MKLVKTTAHRDFAKAVLHTRREFDLTPRAAAARLGITIEELHLVERGELKPPDELHEKKFLNELRGARALQSLWRGEDE